MPNIATVFKEEITRLARKEAKSQTTVLRRANAQYRRDIAALKRVTDRLTRQVSFLEAQERKRATAGPAADATGENRRFSRRGLLTHREKLGFSAADYARLVGVSSQTIYNWEQGRSRPASEQLASLVEVRGLGKREALAKLELLGG